ncbi:MAG: hypothetical protein ACRDU4_10655, partial [Mycobacterium sp.]
MAPDSIVDGYQIGATDDCPYDPSVARTYVVTDAYIKALNARCNEVIQIAAVDVVNKHSLRSASALGNYHVYDPYLPPGYLSSAPSYVVVFDLADGSQVASGVM